MHLKHSGFSPKPDCVDHVNRQFQLKSHALYVFAFFEKVSRNNSILRWLLNNSPGFSTTRTSFMLSQCFAVDAFLFFVPGLCQTFGRGQKRTEDRNFAAFKLFSLLRWVGRSRRCQTRSDQPIAGKHDIENNIYFEPSLKSRSSACSEK